MLFGCDGYVTRSQDDRSYASPGNPGVTLKSELGFSAFCRPRLKMKSKSIFGPDTKLKAKFWYILPKLCPFHKRGMQVVR